MMAAACHLNEEERIGAADEATAIPHHLSRFRRMPFQLAEEKEHLKSGFMLYASRKNGARRHCRMRKWRTSLHRHRGQGMLII